MDAGHRRRRRLPARSRHRAPRPEAGQHLSRRRPGEAWRLWAVEVHLLQPPQRTNREHRHRPLHGARGGQRPLRQGDRHLRAGHHPVRDAHRPRAVRRRKRRRSADEASHGRAVAGRRAVGLPRSDRPGAGQRPDATVHERGRDGRQPAAVGSHDGLSGAAGAGTAAVRGPSARRKPGRSRASGCRRASDSAAAERGSARGRLGVALGLATPGSRAAGCQLAALWRERAAGRGIDLSGRRGADLAGHPRRLAGHARFMGSLQHAHEGRAGRVGNHGHGQQQHLELCARVWSAAGAALRALSHRPFGRALPGAPTVDGGRHGRPGRAVHSRDGRRRATRREACRLFRPERPRWTPRPIVPRGTGRPLAIGARLRPDIGSDRRGAGGPKPRRSWS